MAYRRKTWIERVAYHLYDTPLLGAKNMQAWEDDFYKTGKAVITNVGSYAALGALVGATQGFAFAGAVASGAGRFLVGLLKTVPRVREDEVERAYGRRQRLLYVLLLRMNFHRSLILSSF